MQRFHLQSAIVILMGCVAASVLAQNDTTCPTGTTKCLINPYIESFGFTCCDANDQVCTPQNAAYTILNRRQKCCSEGASGCAVPSGIECFYPYKGEKCCNSDLGMSSVIRPIVICSADQECVFEDNNMFCRNISVSVQCTEEQAARCPSGSNYSCCIHNGQAQCYGVADYTCFDNLLCPFGYNECAGACYNPGAFDCLNDSVLCPHFNSLCGTACYSPFTYDCVDGRLCPRGKTC